MTRERYTYPTHETACRALAADMSHTLAVDEAGITLRRNGHDVARFTDWGALYPHLYSRHCGSRTYTIEWSPV